jgi:hypothetical protein
MSDRDPLELLTHLGAPDPRDELDLTSEPGHAADLAALRARPAHDVPPLVRERLRRQAHRALAASTAPRRTWVMRAYRRAEPLLAGALAASYLLWALGAVLPPG